MPVWNRLKDQGAGYVYDLSEALSIVDWQNPGLLHDVSDGPMFIASDYSGQHRRSSHEAYSFLITTRHAIEKWLPLQEEFRGRWLPDGRRLSFKQLREPVRWRALWPFLDTASRLRGNVVTIMVDCRIKSFMYGGASAIIEAFPDCFPAESKAGTVEKMFRISSLIAMIVAGLKKQAQPLFWVSDHDEALETHERREQFAMLSSYLVFGLTRWLEPAEVQFRTTEAPGAPLWVEDVAAIPDLIAGASCHLSQLLPTFCNTERWVRVLNRNAVSDRRARAIGDWMATTEGSLRHVLLRLELDSDELPRTSAQFFSGSHPSRGLVL